MFIFFCGGVGGIPKVGKGPDMEYDSIPQFSQISVDGNHQKSNFMFFDTLKLQFLMLHKA